MTALITFYGLALCVVCALGFVLGAYWHNSRMYSYDEWALREAIKMARKEGYTWLIIEDDEETD